MKKREKRRKYNENGIKRKQKGQRRSKNVLEKNKIKSIIKM